jgi:hypothetical protein
MMVGPATGATFCGDFKLCGAGPTTGKPLEIITININARENMCECGGGGIGGNLLVQT